MFDAPQQDVRLVSGEEVLLVLGDVDGIEGAEIFMGKTSFEVY